MDEHNALVHLRIRALGREEMQVWDKKTGVWAAVPDYKLGIVPITAIQSRELTEGRIGTCRLVVAPFASSFLYKAIKGEILGDDKDAIEAARLLGDLLDAELIEYVAQDATVSWNGFTFALTAGLNRVPKPVYDVLVTSAVDTADADAHFLEDVVSGGNAEFARMKRLRLQEQRQRVLSAAKGTPLLASGRD